MIFLRVDLSQAEWRVVAALTRDPDLVALARKRPADFDIHTYNAKLIFGEGATKEQRQTGKRTVHAVSYAMGGKRLSEILLNEEGLVRTEGECNRLIGRYLRAFPAIPEWHRRTRSEIMRHRRLINSWGRELSFKHKRLNSDSYKQGYSWIPQSEVGIKLNQHGLLPLDAYIEEKGLRTRINLQVHDELVMSCPVDEVYRVARFLRRHLEEPREYKLEQDQPGMALSIPCTFKVGSSWSGGVEWKALPPRAEMEEAAMKIQKEGR